MYIVYDSCMFWVNLSSFVREFSLAIKGLSTIKMTWLLSKTIPRSFVIIIGLARWSSIKFAKQILRKTTGRFFLDSSMESVLGISIRNFPSWLSGAVSYLILQCHFCLGT